MEEDEEGMWVGKEGRRSSIESAGKDGKWKGE